ncbi:MAG: hypothetical protein LBF40_00560 [Deltaproteobacteria bacterium]|jgi:hypothetical protein|nr:hypothetical protein [Deltaproteobacteria bacterium]
MKIRVFILAILIIVFIPIFLFGNEFQLGDSDVVSNSEKSASKSHEDIGTRDQQRRDVVNNSLLGRAVTGFSESIKTITPGELSCYDLSDDDTVRGICLGDCYAEHNDNIRQVCLGMCNYAPNDNLENVCRGRCNYINNENIKDACESCNGGSIWTALYMKGIVTECN